MAERARGTGRIARSSKLGGVAAGHAARVIGTKAANLVRDDQAAEEAMAQQALETADRLVTVLSTMKGAAMKLGQTFSVVDLGLVPDDRRAEFQAKLAKLQAGAEPRPFREIRQVVERDLGERLAANFDDFSELPIAAASIGQVHRATLKDGRDVAVKVQYPGIDAAVRSDMKNLGLALKLLARISPGLDTTEIADEVRERVAEELDYEHEAANQRAMAREYRGHPFVVVPEVVSELCRQRVIVSEFIDGRRFEEILPLDQPTRNRFGEILARFYVNGPMRHRLLNGDPHPGNSLFLADGRIAFLDFGFFKRMTAREAEIQRQTLQAVREEDSETLHQLMQEQGVFRTPNPEELAKVLKIYANLCGWLLVDDEVEISTRIVTRAIAEQGKMSRADVRLPAEQIVATRAYVLVLSILGQLHAANNWASIAREAIYGDEPKTELGKLEAKWLTGK